MKRTSSHGVVVKIMKIGTVIHGDRNKRAIAGQVELSSDKNRQSIRRYQLTTSGCWLGFRAGLGNKSKSSPGDYQDPWANETVEVNAE